ncbi:hypothetical protein BD626DRAFT_215604 [Schizophyllum amplum]|uniref:Uncharacterized protein n=1 Tax=Schizophyllum amplum TaxID=97359 RepID=A0A550CK88_9AGAR|nr:hypothetical protein BD626DRAFT_215604 [Auriculariopsis ampla]
MSAPTHTNVGYRYRGVLLPDGVTDAHLRSAGICLIKELNSDIQHVVASQLRAAREVEDAPSPRFNFQAEEDDVSEDRRKGFQPTAVAAYLTANNKTDAPMASTDKVATAGDDATGDDAAMDEVAIEVVDSDVDMDISDDEQDGEYTLEYPDDEPQIQVLNYGAWVPMSADSQASVSANVRQPSAHSDYEAPPSSSVSSSSASVAGTPPMSPCTLSGPPCTHL